MSVMHAHRKHTIKWLLDTSTLAQLMPLKAGASMPLLMATMSAINYSESLLLDYAARCVRMTWWVA